MKYIVYKRTSPSGNAYIGYTSADLMVRWKERINEVKGTTLPLAHAIKKYGTKDWTHEILFKTDCVEKAKTKEIEYIEQYGYYNVAKGGNGGNTGRNHEPEKIKRQAKTLSEHWKNLPKKEKERRIKKSMEVRIKNGTMGNNNPYFGIKHGNWNGYWFINNIKYTTIQEAANGAGMNQSTVLDLCVRKVDQVWSIGSKFIEKGKTPRQCGCYKGINEQQI